MCIHLHCLTVQRDLPRGTVLSGRCRLMEMWKSAPGGASFVSDITRTLETGVQGQRTPNT